MSTSGGGGYCDCGDKEAWKVDPFCEVHKVDVPADTPEHPAPDPIDALPLDIQARAQQLFATTINYAAELLTWTQTDTLPKDLMPDMEENYTTMLFNDEVHTYEQVSFVDPYCSDLYELPFH